MTPGARALYFWFECTAWQGRAKEPKRETAVESNACDSARARCEVTCVHGG
jgi:hypothetical protein